MIYTFGLSPIFGIAAIFFLAEAIRGRPFFGTVRRSTSFARGLLFVGLTISQISFFAPEEAETSIIPFIFTAIFFFGALCIWVWQGWSEGSRARNSTPEEERATPTP